MKFFKRLLQSLRGTGIAILFYLLLSRITGMPLVSFALVNLVIWLDYLADSMLYWQLKVNITGSLLLAKEALIDNDDTMFFIYAKQVVEYSKKNLDTIEPLVN